MANLEKRIASLEGAKVDANLKTMTDAELDDYILTLESGSPICFKAIITKVLRHPSYCPVVKSDSEWDKNDYP